MKIISDSQSGITIKPSLLNYVVGWVLLLIGLFLFIVFLPIILANPTPGAWIGTSLFVLFILWWGIWMVGKTTKITFDQPLGYLTVSHNVLTVLLWYIRKKIVISTEEARSIFVQSIDDERGDGSPIERYDVRVIMNSGKEVRLYSDGEQDKADYVAETIKAWANKAVVTN